MIINSKFRDYYDSASGHGVDKAIVYNRTYSEINPKGLVHGNEMIQLGKSKTIWFENTNSGVYRKDAAQVAVEPVLFCGDIYPVIKFYHSCREAPTQYYYSFEKFFEDFIDMGLSDVGISKKKGTWISRSIEESFVNLSNMNSPLWALDLHHEANSPILMTLESSEKWKRKIITNPCLKDINFMGHRDSYTAFQDIAMFISGVLNSSENKMVSISDKDKKDGHGFGEYSFKTLPGGKKHNKE